MNIIAASGRPSTGGRFRFAPIVVGVVLAACGPAPDVHENVTPDTITIGQTCGQVQVEQGAAVPCATFADTLAHHAAVYVARWGTPASFDSWTIRVRTTPISGAPRPEVTVAGTTYYATKTIDVITNALVVLPHEMRHIALGATSNDHHGWCDEFCGWELEALQFDEHAYLGCPYPAGLRSTTLALSR
jgi:hypothetical protein